jgi:hypothetical protein
MAVDATAVAVDAALLLRVANFDYAVAGCASAVIFATSRVVAIKFPS